MAIVPYQDEAERLFWSGPTRLLGYQNASRWNVWRSHPMDGNTAVALACESPEFGNCLRTTCDSYLALLPQYDLVTQDDEDNDVLLRDPHQPLRRCILQWKAFAGVCSSARAVLYYRGSCPPLTQAFETSLSHASQAAIEEYMAWLDNLGAAVKQVRAERTTRKRQAVAPTPPPPSAAPVVEPSADMTMACAEQAEAIVRRQRQTEPDADPADDEV